MRASTRRFLKFNQIWEKKSFKIRGHFETDDMVLVYKDYFY